MFLLCLFAKIKVYMINDDKNIYFLITANMNIMFPLCLLAKIKVYMINDNNNIYFLFMANMNV